MHRIEKLRVDDLFIARRNAYNFPNLISTFLFSFMSFRGREKKTREIFY